MTNWDLSSWRFNDGTGQYTEPGILTLRAGGNLNFGSGSTTASLTDGFTPPAANNKITLSNGTSSIIPLGGASWSYRLIGGADNRSADVMAVKSSDTTGNVSLVAGSEPAASNLANAYSNSRIYTMEQIRTGTGFIDIAAGRNLVLGNRDSVIYTAGQAATEVPTGIIASTVNYYYGTNGGDITVNVKGDVNGAPTDQLITDWLWHQGAIASGVITTRPAWWVNLSSFRQNIGALGGGNVSVTAGGNINDLSAVVPTSGYLDISNPANPVTKVLGGGNLSVTAGGDINSGVFYVGNGLGTVRAGGDLGTDRQYTTTDPSTSITTTHYLYTLLALGQGHYDLSAGGDLNLQSVFNPTALPISYSQNPTGITGAGIKARNFYFTYGDTSGVTLSSLSGNVKISGAGSDLFANAKNNSSGFFYLNPADIQGASVYPGTLQVTALGGNISNNAGTLFPSASGNLRFIAAGNIYLNGLLTMSDADPGSLQASSAASSYATLNSILVGGHNSLHAQDTQPVVISAGGDIIGDNSSSVNPDLTLPKQAQIQAGQDVQNLSLYVQNLNNTDTTSIMAGRDIVFTPYAANPSNATPGIKVTGPGQVVLQAGRNVDLGQSDGVTTTGNLDNPLLPEQGADITVLAGVGQGATGTQAFIDKYIDPAASTTYGADLIAYVENYGAPQGLTTDQAYTFFNTLAKPLQTAFVNKVFFSELKQTGRSAVNTGDYQRGYDAIATLFPSDKYQGDVNLYNSQIKTERGGDINILTPGGGVNAGLANPSSSAPDKKAYEIGIVTVKGGDVNAFVNNDFLVNQSRVFTLQGGNILMWSSYGNIDAGKGSKSATSTPPPLLVVDPKTGTFKVDVTQSVVGSGIRVLLANKDVVPGSVDLIAPTGTINAGDAGIGSAGNITLAALHVVGADNINFGGTGVGVPVTTVAPVSMGGIGNMQDAGKAADQATQTMSTANENLGSFKPSFLSVEVIGLGSGDDCNGLQPDQGCN